MPNRDIEPIRMDDYILAGEGGTAKAYKHKDGKTLVKLFNETFRPEDASEEYLTSCIVYDLGIPTPKPIRLITDGVHYGAEYEYMPNKRSFSRVIKDEPERMEEIAGIFARMTRAIHAKAADTSRVRSAKERFVQFYQHADHVPSYYRERALAFLEGVPDAPYCLHGDLQPGNVITNGELTQWIDVGEFSHGVPEWDLCIFWHMTHNMSAEGTDFLFHLSPATMTAFWDLFLPAYLGTTDPHQIEAANRYLLPFVAVKLPYLVDLVGNITMPEEEFQMLVKSF